MSRNRPLTWLPIIAPLAGAVVAGIWIPLGSWEGSTTGLLVVLSVSTAAILVRLARPIPFNNPTPFEPRELEKLSKSMSTIAQSLRLLVYICLAAMTALIVLPKPGLPASLDPFLLDAASRCGSAVIGSLIAFVVARVSQVVESDISLVELQGELLQQASKRALAKTQQANPPEQAPPIAGSQKFGKPLHS